LELKDRGKSDGHAIITLEDGEKPVVLKIGLSFVSVKNAAENLKKEIGDSDLDAIHQKGEHTWEALLSKIQVSGGSEREKQLFYSSFYRSFLWPALRSDANGEFTDDEGNTRNEKFDYYTLPSLWDTYRNKLVLLGLISPKVTNNVIKSLIHKGELKGFIPTFFHGDHAAPFITGSYLRGIKDFDVEKAYGLLLNNAYKEGGTRPYISEYIQKGFISDPQVASPHVETKAKAGVSKTLEYAYDDYSLALLAKALKDTVHYIDLMKRSNNYKNVFDAKTRFMRGRLENGDWIAPFDPQYPYYEYMYREANAWQLSFYAPHDMKGVVQLYGGREAFESKLDSLFTLPWNPRHIARNVSGFMGQYCHGNQPDHEAPFAYYFVDRPEKSQKIIDTLLADYYGIGEHGLALSGMDDAGEMSSWYVFSALGLYPLSPADPEYLVTVPLFDEVRWQLDKGKELLIQNPNKGRKLKGIKVGNTQNEGYFISHELFINGGKIELMTAQ
jgi:predicted alpha-1,2-mannosidase